MGGTVRKAGKEFPEDVRKLFDAEDVSSVETDVCLEKYSFTAKQQRVLADCLSEKIVRDGKHFAFRRAFCHARIRHGMSLRRVSCVTPITFDRLLDIESGNADLIRPSECRALNGLFGGEWTVENQEVLMEPSGTGVVVKLSDMAEFDNFHALDLFAESHCCREFDEDDLPGFSGVVVECQAEEIGSGFKGRVYIQISELRNLDDRGVFLCRTCNGEYRILEKGKECFLSSDGVKSSAERLVWRLPVRQIVFKVNDRSYWI